MKPSFHKTGASKLRQNFAVDREQQLQRPHFSSMLCSTNTRTLQGTSNCQLQHQLEVWSRLASPFELLDTTQTDLARSIEPTELALSLGTLDVLFGIKGTAWRTLKCFNAGHCALIRRSLTIMASYLQPVTELIQFLFRQVKWRATYS